MSNKQLKELLTQVDKQVDLVESSADWENIFKALRDYPHSLSFNYKIHLPVFLGGIASLLWVAIQEKNILEFPPLFFLILGIILVTVSGIIMSTSHSQIKNLSEKIFFKDLRLDYKLKPLSRTSLWFNQNRKIFKELMRGSHGQEILSLYQGFTPKSNSEYYLFQFDYAVSHTQTSYNVALKMYTTQTVTKNFTRYGLICSLKNVPSKEKIAQIDPLFNDLHLSQLTLEYQGRQLCLGFDNNLLRPALPCLLSDLDIFEAAIKAPAEVEQLEKIFNLIWVLES